MHPLPDLGESGILFDSQGGGVLDDQWEDDTMPTDERDRPGLPEGTPVQVRDRFEFAFRSGFVVAAATGAGYRLRRSSDGVELPSEFAEQDVRPERDGGWR